jgi:hypothetical protein
MKMYLHTDDDKVQTEESWLSEISKDEYIDKLIEVFFCNGNWIEVNI